MTVTELYRLLEHRAINLSKESRLKEQGRKCFWCSNPVSWRGCDYVGTNGKVRKATKDHLFSKTDDRRYQMGGLAWVIACNSCNSKRSNQTEEGAKMAGSWNYAGVVPMIIEALESRFVVAEACLYHMQILKRGMGDPLPSYVEEVEMHFKRQVMREQRGW